MRNKPKKKTALVDEWFVIGIALGVAFGIIFDNIGFWLPIGVCIGLVGPTWKKIKKNNNNNEPDKE